MSEEQALICALCSCEMKPITTQMSYLGHSFQVELPRCPQCGQIYIPEALATGRIAQVESELEDK